MDQQAFYENPKVTKDELKRLRRTVGLDALEERFAFLKAWKEVIEQSE